MDRKPSVCFVTLPLLLALLLPAASCLKGSIEFVDTEKDGDTWLLEPGSRVTMVISYEIEDQDIGKDPILHLHSWGQPPITTTNGGRYSPFLDLVEAQPPWTEVLESLPPYYRWRIPTSIPSGGERKGRIEILFSVPSAPDREYAITATGCDTHTAFARSTQAPEPQATSLVIHYLDIGQGDATLILYENWTILIDSGGRFNAQRDKMQSYLSELNITTINLAIATHADADHIGQFTNIMNSLTVEEFWVNGLSHTSQLWETMNETIHNLSIPLHVARIHDRYVMGDACLLVVSPWEPMIGEQNADSIVIKLIYGSFAFLFMGDADEETEHRLMPLSSIWPHADVLKVGDHGSSTSSSEEWLNAVHPSVAIISAGYGNEYGHPHNETLARLSAKEITVFRTDIHDEFIDDVIATTNGHALTIMQQSTGQVWMIQEHFFVAIAVWLATSRYRVLTALGRCGTVCPGATVLGE